MNIEIFIECLYHRDDGFVFEDARSHATSMTRLVLQVVDFLIFLAYKTLVVHLLKVRDIGSLSAAKMAARVPLLVSVLGFSRKNIIGWQYIRH